MSRLVDYRTGETIRRATAREDAASVAAAELDGGRGVIRVDGVSCYTDGGRLVSVSRCSGCGEPAHASETDDLDRCAKCAELAGEPHVTECAYCAALVGCVAVPGRTDGPTWAELAQEHAEGCEWVATRAHRGAP